MELTNYLPFRTMALKLRQVIPGLLSAYTAKNFHGPASPQSDPCICNTTAIYGSRPENDAEQKISLFSESNLRLETEQAKSYAHRPSADRSFSLTLLAIPRLLDGRLIDGSK